MSEPLDDTNLKYLVLDMLKQQSARDKQTTVGPSSIGDPCDYCLGLAVSNTKPHSVNHWWMGARIGTAIHETLEKAAEKHIEKPRSTYFAPLENALLESKVRICVIEGYGMISGSADLVLTEHDHLVDYKSTTRAKINKIKLAPVKRQYYIQQQLYMYGLNTNHGMNIKKASLVFICRDGASNADVYIQSFDYDESAAEEALDRLGDIIKMVKDGHIDDLASHADCYDCTNKYLRN